MRLAFIEATDLGDAWFQALNTIMTRGRKYLVTSGSYEGIYRSGMPVTIHIRYPGTRPLYPLMPEGSGQPPPTDEEDINNYLLYLMTGDREKNEHYTYGEDLHWENGWVIKHFKKYGYGTNHCYMTVGRPETAHNYDCDIDCSVVVSVKDLEGSVIREAIFTNAWNKDPKNKPSSQCLRGIDVWIEDNKLHFWVYFRSWDLWGGFPVNLGGIQLLKEYMAGELDVEDGEMVVSCKDLHVYEHTWLIALTRLGRSEKK